MFDCKGVPNKNQVEASGRCEQTGAMSSCIHHGWCVHIHWCYEFVCMYIYIYTYHTCIIMYLFMYIVCVYTCIKSHWQLILQVCRWCVLVFHPWWHCLLVNKCFFWCLDSIGTKFCRCLNHVKCVASLCSPNVSETFWPAQQSPFIEAFRNLSSLSGPPSKARSKVLPGTKGPMIWLRSIWLWYLKNEGKTRFNPEQKSMVHHNLPDKIIKIAHFQTHPISMG